MKRRKFTPEFKTQVVLEALKERSTIKELAQKHRIHPQQITNWKKAFLSNATQVFTGSDNMKSEEEKEKDRFLRTIGELKVENDFLKKRLK